MWKLTDIVGLKIDESDNLFLKVYTNIKSNKISYVLTNQYKDVGDFNTRFNTGKKNKQVDNFYKFLKSSGSAIIYDETKKLYTLVGKDLFEFDNAVDLHLLCEFEENPINDEIFNTLDASVAELSLEEILFNEFGEGHGYMLLDC